LEVSIKYFKDGQEISPDKIGGTSGDVEIKMHLKNTTGKDEQLSYNMFKGNSGNFSKTTYTPFMVNAVVELSLDKFSNISAPDAANIVVGKTMKLNFLVFPYPEKDLDIKAIASNFELNPISINVIPQMPPLTVPDLEPKLAEMYDGIGEMDSNLGRLSDGAAAAQEGLIDLNAGLKKFSAGLDQAATGSSQLAAATPALSGGIDQLSAGTEKLIMAQDGQIKMIQIMEQGNAQLEQALTVLAKTPGFEKQGAQLLAGIQKEKSALALLEKGGKLPDGTVFPGLDTTKAGTQQIKAGLTGLKTGADKASAGVMALNAGLSQLDKNAPALVDGSSQLVDGMNKIDSGVKDFRSIAISKLQTGISDQINEVRKGNAEVDRIQNRVDSYTTFTGDEGLQNSKTEFLMQTDSIKGATEKDNTGNSSVSASSTDKNIFARIADFFADLF
jgi:putative membrane protein